MDLAIRLQEVTGKDYFTYTSLKYALQDVRLFEMYCRGQLSKDSDALTFGSLYDTMLFEKDAVNDRFVVLDDAEIVAKIGGASPRATKAYKEWKEMYVADLGGKRIVSADDFDKAAQMINRLEDTGIVGAYLKGEYQKELAGFIGDVPVRGFLDCLGDGYVSDSKSTRAISGFRRDIFSFGYDIQAYIYSELAGTREYYWVAQDTSYPFTPKIFKASERTLEGGRIKFDKAVSNVQKFLFSEIAADLFYDIEEV
jgi:hypothetical protein